jgi:hypothetical protein
MAELSREYASLPPEEMARFKAQGLSATVSGRRKLRQSDTSFGPKRRKLERAAMTAHQQALSNLVALAEEEMADAASLPGIDIGGDGLLEAVEVAKRRASVRTRARLAELREEACTLKAYNNSVGLDACNRWKASFPECKGKVAPFPVEMGAGIRCASTSTEDNEKVANLVGDLGKRGGGWEAPHAKIDVASYSMNAPIMRAVCDDDNPEQTSEQRYCRVAGMCLCTDDGRQLVRLRESFHTSVLKPMAPAHSDGRNNLKEGRNRIVLHGKAAAGDGAGVPAEDAAAPCVELIWHVCYMVCSPWTPTWLRLRRVGAIARLSLRFCEE